FDLPLAAVGELVERQFARGRRAVVVQPGFRFGDPALRAGAPEGGLGRRHFAGDDDVARPAVPAHGVAGFGEQRADRGFGLGVVALAEARVAHLAARVYQVVCRPVLG